PKFCFKNDAMKYGPLDNFSAFPFESYLGKLKRKIRTGNRPLQQVHRRLQETQEVSKNSRKIVIPSLTGLIGKDFAPSEAEDNQVYRKLFTENFSLSANKKDCCSNPNWELIMYPVNSSDLGIFTAKVKSGPLMFALVDFVSEKGTDGTIPCEVVHLKWKTCYWPGNKNYIQEFKRGGEKLKNWKECDVEVKFVSDNLADVREYRHKHIQSTTTDSELEVQVNFQAPQNAW
ncbi:unnamed protein product, partial [Allacma fusca]